MSQKSADISERFEQAKEAYLHLQGQTHIGKIVIRVA